MNDNYEPPVKLERRDFYDVLADLPPLPEGAVIGEPHSSNYPIPVDNRTGVYYHYNRDKNVWELADK